MSGLYLKNKHHILPPQKKNPITFEQECTYYFHDLNICDFMLVYKQSEYNNWFPFQLNVFTHIPLKIPLNVFLSIPLYTRVANK